MAVPRPPRRSPVTARSCAVVCAALTAVLSLAGPYLLGRRRDSLDFSQEAQAFLALDEKDGRFCGKEGDICKCFGHVRYGRLFTWSDDLLVDGSVNCSAALFGDPMPLDVKICKCYPTICTTDVGTCTPEPCGCPVSRDPAVEWAKKSLMTSDGTKCWACEKRAALAGVAVNEDSAFCPTQLGRCTLKRSCKCAAPTDTKRVMRTKDGQKCWTCAPISDGDGPMRGQRAMFWMLPLLWPFMDLPESIWEVCRGCRALTSFLAICVVGYVLQNFAPLLQLNRFFSFYAPTLKKGEFWRLFTYTLLHSDLQHLCINLFHLLDTLDLENVPDLEVSLGVPLRCTRDGPVASVCYPNVGMGSEHTVKLILLVLAFGALVGTIKNFGALVQGASSVCFGVDGALIALYAMFLGAGLDQQLKIPEFGAFFWMRIGIIGFHIVIDVVQSVCGAGKDTVGTMAHMASLVAGFCYVIIVLPPMGTGDLFQNDQPYIINCGMTSPKYVTLEEATAPCVAFFRRGNGMEVASAQLLAKVVLASGVAVSVVNAIRNRHISDDGIACCSSGTGGAAAAAAGKEQEDPLAEERQRLALHEQQEAILKEEVKRLERLIQNMPARPFASGAAAAAAAAPEG